MPLIEKSFKQRSEQWYQARLGNPGASEFSNIITSEGIPSKSRIDYMYRLAAEKIRGKSDETFQSEAMVNGELKEEEAKKYFELLHNVKIKDVGMVYKNEEKLFHASPDGLIGKNQGIEIKCPTAKVHAQYLYEGKLPTKFIPQIQGSLYVCERKYWWFMSYCDSMKPLLIRVKRDEIFIKKVAVELKVFCSELKAIVKKIK